MTRLLFILGNVLTNRGELLIMDLKKENKRIPQSIVPVLFANENETDTRCKDYYVINNGLL